MDLNQRPSTRQEELTEESCYESNLESWVVSENLCMLLFSASICRVALGEELPAGET